MTDLNAWITNSINLQKSWTWAKSTWSTRLIAGLLVGDLLLLLAHFLLAYGLLLSNHDFFVDVDGGYGEWFQYLKYTVLIVLMAGLFRRQRGPLYLFWTALFAYFLLDDALRLHEQVGLWLAETADLPALLTLRPRDLGEMSFSGVSGLFFLTALVLAYQHSDLAARRFTQKLLLALAALIFFGIGVDMVQVMTEELVEPYQFLRELLIVLEEGGEMMAVSVMVWLAYRQAEWRQAWTIDEAPTWLRETAVAALLFGVVTAVLFAIQSATPALVGNDGYYHAKMALLIRQEGLAAHPLLPFTILNEADFYNHHMLYHLYLALFAWTDPVLDGGVALTQGVKTAATLMAALPFMAIWWLLRGQGVRWPALWTVALLALSEPFLYRLSMPRVQSASLLVLVLGLHWLLQGKHRRLLPLGAAYVWLYDGFPLLLLLGGVYFAAVWLTERRLLWPALLYPALGIVIGLVVNPFFPQNLTFISHHLWAKLAGTTSIPVGSEWYPYDTWALVQHSGLALALFVGTLLLLNWRGQRWDVRLLTLFGVTVVFGLMLLRARRFIEYYPAFVLIFAAVSLSPLVVKWWEAERPLRFKWLLAGCAVLLLLPGWHTVQAARASVANSAPADRYAAAALWLNAYSEPGSMVFQADWDDFTRLFFYNSEANYTVGLDPTFMARYDETLYDEWVAITRGKIDDPVPVIQEKFGADYIFSDLDHTELLGQLAEAPNVQEVYRDDDAVIFQIIAEKGPE
ncbi:MAG: hypothetical protein CL608_02160 [Anaerolineaceae bacterium]|nr:hypothetical protein [Anaerolineaceae bacterium]